jgi:hypothetical protein
MVEFRPLVCILLFKNINLVYVLKYSFWFFFLLRQGATGGQGGKGAAGKIGGSVSQSVIVATSWVAIMMGKCKYVEEIFTNG